VIRAIVVIMALMLVCAVASCGVDGAPARPDGENVDFEGL